MSRKRLLILFLLALGIRLAYVGLVIWFDGSFDNGSDSGKYLLRAANLLEYGKLVYLDYGVLIPDTGRMPVYPYFLAAILGLAGKESLWVVVVVQAFIDSLTVFAVALLAGAINRRWMLPAAVLACMWTTTVVYSAFVLTDTLFLAFFTWGLCATLWAVRGERRLTLLIAAGVLFGLAVLTRPVLMFFPYALAPALALLLWRVSGVPGRRAAALALIPAILMLLALVPRLAMTYDHFGVPLISTQSGNQAIDVVDQFLRLCPEAECDSARTETAMHALIGTRLAERGEEERKNPLILDRIRRKIAVEHLLDIPVPVIAKGVALAATRSLLQTGLYETGYQLRQDPRYFSSVPGETFSERAQTFVMSIFSNGFLLAWALAQLGVFVALVFQIVGTASGLRDERSRPFILFLLMAAVYFLVVNGPFGNPRYAMPLTPALIVFTAAGFDALLEWWDERWGWEA
jgi:4-amino-4-deoxy-L-arabinose transferase-like glycosyltransferase